MVIFVRRLLKKQKIFCGCLLLVVGYLPTVLNLIDDYPLPAVLSETGAVGCCFAKNDQIYDSQKLIFSSKSFDCCKDSMFLPTYRFDNSGFLLAFRNDNSDNLYTTKNNKFYTISNGLLAGAILVKSSIQNNFYVDALRLRIPVKVVDTVIHNLSSKIDFNRSLKRGDKFEIVYNKNNEPLYAKIVAGKKSAAFYRFTHGKKSVYYASNGVQLSSSNKREFFARPLKCAYRVSSNYGMRVHPITRVWHHHTGADLCVNYGSPVYAIQDGVVTRASRYYGYGNCIDISHKSGYASRYAHLSRCAVRYGARVKRGQLIGHVGSSGSSTGPHLHLELLKNNRAINPFSIKMLPQEGVGLAAREFFIYKRVFDSIINKY